MQMNALLHIVDIPLGLMQEREKVTKGGKENPSGNRATQPTVRFSTGGLAQPQDMATTERYKLTLLD